MNEALDRRAFLRGMMLTSAGVLVPKPARIYMPPPSLAGQLLRPDLAEKFDRVSSVSSVVAIDRQVLSTEDILALNQVCNQDPRHVYIINCFLEGGVKVPRGMRAAFFQVQPL